MQPELSTECQWTCRAWTKTTCCVYERGNLNEQQRIGRTANMWAIIIPFVSPTNHRRMWVWGRSRYDSDIMPLHIFYILRKDLFEPQSNKKHLPNITSVHRYGFIYSKSQPSPPIVPADSNWSRPWLCKSFKNTGTSWKPSVSKNMRWYWWRKQSYCSTIRKRLRLVKARLLHNVHSKQI